jgi:hypothetical protein
MALAIGFLLTTLTLLLGELRYMHHHICGIVKQVDNRAEFYYQTPNLRDQPFLIDYMNIQRNRDCNRSLEDDEDDSSPHNLSPTRQKQKQKQRSSIPLTKDSAQMLLYRNVEEEKAPAHQDVEAGAIDDDDDEESEESSVDSGQNLSQKSIKGPDHASKRVGYEIAIPGSRRISITTDEAISLALASMKASEKAAYNRMFN